MIIFTLHFYAYFQLMLTIEMNVPEAMIVPKSSQGISCCTGTVLPEASAANRLLVNSKVHTRSIERILNKRFMIATSVAFYLWFYHICKL